jgi:hypothetical protein
VGQAGGAKERVKPGCGQGVLGGEVELRLGFMTGRLGRVGGSLEQRRHGAEAAGRRLVAAHGCCLGERRERGELGLG